MTPVLVGNSLLFEGSNSKIEDIHRFQVYIHCMQLLVTAIQMDSLYMHICTYHPPWVNHVVFVVSTRMIHEHLRVRCDVFRHFPGDRDAE